MEDQVTGFLNMLAADKLLAYDIESDGLDWKRQKTVGYSISDGVDAFYVPVRHALNNIPNPEAFERLLADSIKRRTAPLIGHNVKFDMHFSQNHGVLLGNNVKDTMVRGALLNENRKSYALDYLASHYKIEQKKGKELYAHIAHTVGGPATRESMALFWRLRGNDPYATEYAKGDTKTTFQLYQEQQKEIDAADAETPATYGLSYIEHVESQLTYVLQKMERRGIKVDLAYLPEVVDIIGKLHYEAHLAIPLDQETLLPVNVRSQYDLERYFRMCDILDWPINDPTERFPDGSPKFDKAFLAKHEEGLVVLNARKYEHFKSTFLQPFPTYVYNGRIHTRYNQAIGEFGGAKPGRLSSAEPNMQFVPKRDKQLGRIFRKLFIPDPGYTLVELDYSQAEPRLFTHYSGEEKLLQGYNSTPYIDMHQIAADYMGISRDEGIQNAKNLNLGMMYVMGNKTLAGHLNCDLQEAKIIAKKWHKTFPAVSSFTKKASQVAQERGWVKTILGRRARFDDPRWSYRAANRIVQGGSADILKYKMVEIETELEQKGLDKDIQMLLTIHDSLVFQIKDEVLDTGVKLVKGIMQDVQSEPFNLRVPFIAEGKSGKNWTEATYDGRKC